MEPRNSRVSETDQSKNGIGTESSVLAELGGRILSDKFSGDIFRTAVHDGKHKDVELAGYNPDFEKVMTAAIQKLMAEKHWKELEKLLKNFLKYNEDTYGKVSKQVAGVYYLLGFACESDGRYADAEKYFRSELALDKIVYGKDHPMTGRASECVGAMLTKQGKHKESVPFFEEALRIFRKNDPMGNREVGLLLAMTIEDYLPALKALGQNAYANKLYQEYRKLIESMQRGKGVLI